MTDYEIIKNLEACKKGNCTDCSLNCIKSEACITLLCSYAFELINCQQAEIEGLENIDNQPAADVAPVKHGKWNVGYFHDRVCSVCTHPDSDLNVFPHKYCPNCGAKMDDEIRKD